MANTSALAAKCARLARLKGIKIELNAYNTWQAENTLFASDEELYAFLQSAPYKKRGRKKLILL